MARKTIGKNPLDAVIPEPKAEKKAEAGDRSKAERGSSSGAKQRLIVHLSEDLINRVKNSVYWTPGLTLAVFAEESLKEALDRFEKKREEPFPQRESELKGGRPLK